MLCFVAGDMTHGTYRPLAIGEDELEPILTIIREGQKPAVTSKGDQSLSFRPQSNPANKPSQFLTFV